MPFPLQSLAQSAATAMGMPYQELLSSWEGKVVDETMVETDFSLAVSTASSTPLVAGSSSPHSNKNRRARIPKHDDKHQQPEEKIVGYWQSAIAAERRRATNSPHHAAMKYSTVSSYNDGVGASKSNGVFSALNGDRTFNSTLPDTEEILPVAFEIARTKNLKKAVDYLIACDFLTPSPRDVAAFLRLHRSQLDPSALGIFLAEGGNGGGEVDYWNQIRFNYFRPISFVGMNVEQG